jgi:hypothetical protein
VTGLGIAAFILLFLGLALGIVALVLLLRKSSVAPLAAIIAVVLFLPALLASRPATSPAYERPALSKRSRSSRWSSARSP